MFGVMLKNDATNDVTSHRSGNASPNRDTKGTKNPISKTNPTSPLLQNYEQQKQQAGEPFLTSTSIKANNIITTTATHIATNPNTVDTSNTASTTVITDQFMFTN